MSDGIPNREIGKAVPYQPGENEALARMIHKAVMDGPPPIVAGPDNPNFAFARVDDGEIVNRVRHTMRQNEKLGEWYSRIGLGRAQILSMSQTEITAFVAQADKNNEDTFNVHPLLDEPQSPQDRFVLAGN